MSEREIVKQQMAKKASEIEGLEDKLKVAKVYLKALEDILKAFEKGEVTPPNDGDVTLRKGSLVARARDVILKRGAPVHIDDLLEALGRTVSRESKASLTGSLAAYVRKEEIFTRPAPSTFGLIELDHFETEEVETAPPPDFGYGTTPADEDDEIPF